MKRRKAQRKKTPVPATTAAQIEVQPIRYEDCDSVEVRLSRIRRSLGVASQALKTPIRSDESAALETLQGIYALVFDALEETHWLARLPPDVLQAPAPDGDNYFDGDNGSGWQVQGLDFWERRAMAPTEVREFLSRMSPGPRTRAEAAGGAR